jgi:hypothetical protein
VPGIQELQNWDNRQIRKHALQIIALADASVTAPTDFFTTADASASPPTLGGELLALPTGFYDGGYITTDGGTISRDISTADVNSVQTAEFTRSDIETDQSTFQVVFQETSNVTWALQFNEEFANMPAKGERLDFHRDRSGVQPRRRLLILTQDGVGDQAVYRVEFGPNVQITDTDDRSLQRSDEEQNSFTFTPYFDRNYVYTDAAGKQVNGTSWRALQDGPGQQALAAA